MSAGKSQAFYDAANSDPIAQKLGATRDDVGDDLLQRIKSKRTFRFKKSTNQIGFYADTTRLAHLDMLNGHSFDGTVRRWFLKKEVELVANADDDSMAQKLFCLVRPILAEHLEKHREELLKAKDITDLKNQLKVISEGIKEDLMQKAQTELKKELTDIANEYLVKKVKSSILPKLILRLAGLGPLNPITMLGFVQEMNHQSLHDGLLARDVASKSEWKTQELTVGLIEVLKKENVLQMVAADRTDKSAAGLAKDFVGQSSIKGEEMLDKGAEMASEILNKAKGMVDQLMGGKDKESSSGSTKSDEAGKVENPEAVNDPSGLSEEPRSDVKSGMGTKGDKDGSGEDNLSGTEENAVDLSHEFKDYYDEVSAQARRLTNMVLSLLAVFVSPYFQQVHGVVLAMDEMELRLQQMLIETVTKQMDPTENPTFKTAEFILKLAAPETAEKLHCKAAEVAQKVGVDKALRDAQQTVAGFLNGPLKMVIDEAKKHAAKRVEQKMDSKFQELIELIVKLTGKDIENVDAVLRNVKEGHGEAYDWLKVLCYPVFAPDHKEASEYILRKLVLFKKIKNCLNDSKLVGLQKKIEELTQPFQDMLDKETESVIVFSEDGPSEELKGGTIEIWRLRKLLDLSEESVDAWISALNGNGVAALEKLKLDEKSQQLKDFKETLIEEVKKERAAIQKAVTTKVQNLSKSDVAQNATKTASDMVQVGINFAGSAANVVKGVRGQDSSKKEDTKPQQSH
eukprot:gnl/MRDRNA2_/MRDRNA2_74715_c0_seq2.p1 gnl/MRDRNA2_/MRDRNA2_74715_c0~~gnl/MRDRNA2_/MRDRNA2_74715_c0_seq2.p1  ORF type:complete len:741 (-),score=145.35 gnl/MRDRNA2_/MRDRNA2_74715_c0_seq2:33-2255(-)